MSFVPDCLKYLRSAPSGLCLEFGWGPSTVMLGTVGRPVFSFDCGRGLPHDWGEGDAKGAFTSSPPEVPSHVTLVEGLFSDTLEDFLKQHTDKVAFCHIDCDLYTSTAYVLNSLKDRWMPKAFLIFDEINQQVRGEREPGERRAFAPYIRDWGLCEFIHSAGAVYCKLG